MGPSVVYEGVPANQSAVDGLFAGMKLWLSCTVPQRSRFIDDVKSNGGEVVPLEKQADICLFDHMHKNPPPGVYSFRFVELSIRNGRLEDLESHKIGGIGKRAARPVGSVTLASKGSRKPFTEADDQMLWDWVKPHEGMKGSAGNVLYQQLEEVNPRHTFQSWRDRWLKYVQYQDRSLTSTNSRQQQDEKPVDKHLPSTLGNPKGKARTPNGPTLSSSRAVRTPVAQQPIIPKAKSRSDHTLPTSASQSSRRAVVVPVDGSPRRRPGRPPKRQRPQSTGDTVESASLKSGSQTRSSTEPLGENGGGRDRQGRQSRPEPEENTEVPEFSKDDRERLLISANTILSVPEKDLDNLWQRMAKEHTSHTAHQWRAYFKEVVVPLYHGRQKVRERKKHTTGLAAEQDHRSVSTGSANKRGEEERRGKRAAGLHHHTWQNGLEDKSDARLGRKPHQRRTSCESQSPTGWQGRNSRHDPGPNEAWKRGPATIDLQESTKSRTPDSVAQRGLSDLHVSRIDQSIQYVGEDSSRPKKRRKLSTGEATVLEIPSTPGNSQGNELSDATDQQNIKPETRTSPISVDLFSDFEPASTSSSSVLHEDAVQSESAGSSTPDFETAPDFSHMRRSTEPEEEEETDGFETAVEEPEAQCQSVPDTQALFAGPVPNVEDLIAFDLAEPEGGWGLYEADSAQDEDGARVSPPNSPASSIASTLDLDLDEWVALRCGEGCDQDLLVEAAEATSMHMKLADVVYESVNKGKGIPPDMKGVWTKSDDEHLKGTNSREIERLGKKHGRTNVNERFECHSLWNTE